MPLWLWFLDSLGLVVAALALFLLGLVVRRRLIARAGSTFDLSISFRHGPSPRGWTLGVGRYTDNQLEWFRVFSLSWRPRHRFDRGQVEVLRRREPHGTEAFSLHAGTSIIESRTDAGPVQFALSPDALTGLLAWLESAPPGRNADRVI